MNKKVRSIVTEEMHPEVKWFEEAKKQTFDTLPKFIDKMMNEYIHDYGTICHAIGACAVATASAGASLYGITGFQAGFVMWDFIRYWLYESNKCGLHIVNWDDMLYPQNIEKFEKTMDENVWEHLQEQAKLRLKEYEDVEETCHHAVLEHWKSIASGTVPFGYKVWVKTNG